MGLSSSKTDKPSPPVSPVRSSTSPFLVPASNVTYHSTQPLATTVTHKPASSTIQPLTPAVTYKPAASTIQPNAPTVTYKPASYTIQPSAPTVTYKPTPSTIQPSPPKLYIANVDAYHAANNYIIPNITMSGDQRVFNIHQGKIDRYYLKVCSKYISRNGCVSNFCYRFHVCQFWVRGDCKKSNCSFDHHFNNLHNLKMTQLIFWSRFGESDLIEKLNRNFYGTKDMKDISNYICMDNILRQCKRDHSCEAIHVNGQFSWEIYTNNKWISLPYNQSVKIENGFCNPENSFYTLDVQAATPGRKSQTPNLENSQTYNIDFENMSLQNDSQSFFRIRRLSTPSDMAFFKTVATRWLWFWEDDAGCWKYFANGFANDFGIIGLSDYIEFKFLKREKEFSFQFYRNAEIYTINFENMTMAQRGFTKSKKIRRRPMGEPQHVKWNDNTTLISLWSDVNHDKRYRRQKINPDSPEFYFVQSMIKRTLSITEIYIERVENHHLWQFYQLNKAKMLKAYNNNLKSLNEQYLFHGTSQSVVDKICSDNLDWRLHGTNVGNVFGRGTYFSNSAAYSKHYAPRGNEGYHYMFIVLVLIGKAVVGDSTMTLPPEDPTTKQRFDTTVNNTNPEIFVKYNLDDYYPAYLVMFQS